MCQDESLTSHWGTTDKITGPRNSGAWPGANGVPPMVIPSDKCVIKFVSHSGEVAWGLKLSITAPVDNNLAVAMSKNGWSGVRALALKENAQGTSSSPKSPSTPLTLSLCEKALAVTNHVKMDALRWLWKVGFGDEDLPMELSAKEPHFSGIFRDSSGGVEVNIQTGEVSKRD